MVCDIRNLKLKQPYEVAVFFFYFVITNNERVNVGSVLSFSSYNVNNNNNLSLFK